MSRLYFLSCFCLIFINSSHCIIEQFLFNETSPKCCSLDEILAVVNVSNDISYDCIFDRNRTSYILTNEVVSMNELQYTSCVDDYFEEESGGRHVGKLENFQMRPLAVASYFPKCCPLNSAYDMYEHKCVDLDRNETDFVSFTEEFLTEHLSKGLFFIKTGLIECTTVIADYEIPVFDEKIFDANKALHLQSLNASFAYGSYCVDKVINSGKYVGRVCHQDFSVCKKKTSDDSRIRCIRKCCPDGNMYIGGPVCKFDFKHGLSFGNDSKIKNLNEPFAIIQGHHCRKYLVNEDWNYTLDEMGNLKLNLEEDRTSYTPFDHTYCFEHVNLGDALEDRRLFLCFKYKDKNRIEFQISRIALLISSIFLFLTLVGYMLLPEMQNLHGKTLMCHCGSLLIASLILVVMQFDNNIDGTACMALGYTVMYTFLVAFLWSNIMCFDIWWTFGSMRVQGIHQKRQECRRFMWYCIYSLSIPAIITGGAFTMQWFGDYIPESLEQFVPRLGGYTCFFEQRTNTAAFLIWFTLPIAIIVTCNFVLYLKTISYCHKVKKAIEKMKATQTSKNEKKKLLSADNEKMKMAVKLFLVMGISWLFESISVWTIPVPATGAAQIIQIIFDTINCLQGLFIFCIFILKVKFISALRKKLGSKYLRRTSQSTSGITVTTYVPPLNKSKV